MINWLKKHDTYKKSSIQIASNSTGLPESAIEKDLWVCLTLKAIFSLPYKDNIVFKGGTSLSKGWKLIERFSEDIDLAIDRSKFNYSGELGPQQIKKLRKDCCSFVRGQFKEDIQNLFEKWGVNNYCQVITNENGNSDTDPEILKIEYNSLFQSNAYLANRILVEMTARSLKEPFEERQISPELNLSSSENTFLVSAVLPQRTFLEKMFLLHEQFYNNGKEIKTHRYSRHLYDLEKIMDTEHGISALSNKDLFNSIVQHRSTISKNNNIDYTAHVPSKIRIVPPDSVVQDYAKDYEEMRTYMIYDSKSLTFKNLLERINELQRRINQVQFTVT